MPISAADIQFCFSGGSTNADGNVSLGGQISVNEVLADIHALFGRVTDAEASSGVTDYRCVYVKNANASLFLYGATVWVSSNTPSVDTAVAIALGSSALNGVEQTIADKLQTPLDVTFSAPSSYETGIFIGDIPPGQHRAVWLRRTVSEMAAAYNNDNFTLACQGESGA